MRAEAMEDDDVGSHLEGPVSHQRLRDAVYLVIVLALACTLAWTGFWLWAIVRGLHIVFS